MQEHEKKAFDFASDLTKQLITLSTGIVTLSVTFSKDIIGEVDDSKSYILFTSWIAFILSLLFGVLTLMALTGNLDPKEVEQKQPDGSMKMVKPQPITTITSRNVTSTSVLQLLFFFIAIVSTCTYGYFAASNKKNLKGSSDQYVIVRRTQLGSDTTIYIDTLYVSRKGK